jgi:NADH:ubiquinone oxidoreductase subunit 3 (subunit A)
MPDNYFARYLPLLIHFLVAGALAGAIVLLSWLIGYRRPTRALLRLQARTSAEKEDTPAGLAIWLKSKSHN